MGTKVYPWEDGEMGSSSSGYLILEKERYRKWRLLLIYDFSLINSDLCIFFGYGLRNHIQNNRFLVLHLYTRLLSS